MIDEHLRTDEPFERDLRAVLDELAPSAVPATLRAAVDRTVLSPPSSRVHRWFPGRARVAGAVGVVIVLVLGALVVVARPATGPGGSPSPRSSLVAGWVQQIDGVYGYSMLRPTNWTPTGGDFPNGREYVAPGGTASGDIVIRAVNLQLPAAHPAGAGGSVEWPVFEAAPTLGGWTAGLERQMTREGQPFELLRTLPEAKIYALALPNGASGYAFIVAYIVDQGQPLIVSLGASGTDGDLGFLKAQGLVDDFVSMVGSVDAISADARVEPALPAATGPQPASTPVVAASPTVPPSPSPLPTTVTVPLGGTHAVVVSIYDASGLLVSARPMVLTSATPIPASYGGQNIAAWTPSGRPEAEVWLYWGGVICDTTSQLVIGAGATTMTVTEGPRPACDASNDGRGLVLTFAHPIDATTVAVTFVGAQPSP